MIDEHPSSLSSGEETRRTVLKTLGIAGVIGVAGVGPSTATPGTHATDGPPKLMWLRRYPEWNDPRNDSGSAVHSVIPQVHSGYVAANDELVIHEVNEGGKTVSSASIDRGSSEGTVSHNEDLVQLSDGEFVIVGMATPPSEPGTNAPSYGFVTKTDVDGNVLWDREYGRGGEGTSVRFDRALATPDGGVLVVGRWENIPTESGDDYSNDVFIVKLTADGDEAWQRIGDLAHDDRAAVNVNLDVTADGQYLMSTWRGLYVLDDDGEVVWDRPFDDWEVYDTIATDDGGTAWAANRTGENGFSMVKTDGSGAVQWHETYHETVPGWGLEIAERDDGFALAGRTDGTGEGNDGDFALMGAGPNGSYQWHTVFGSGDYDEVARDGDLVVHDGTYVICGVSRPDIDAERAGTIAKLEEVGHGHGRRRAS